MVILYLKLTVIMVSFIFVISHESYKVFIFLYKWGNWGPEKLGNFPEPHSLVSLPDRIKPNPIRILTTLLYSEEELKWWRGWAGGGDRWSGTRFSWKEAAGTSRLESWGEELEQRTRTCRWLWVRGSGILDGRGCVIPEPSFCPLSPHPTPGHCAPPVIRRCGRFLEQGWGRVFYSNFSISFTKESIIAMHLLYLCG